MSQLLHDPATHKTGKLDPKPPHAMFSDFVDVERVEATETIPVNIINSLTPAGLRIALAMYLNDSQGDCTCAGAGNITRVDSDGAVQITDSNVEAGYVYVTGEEGAAYNPATGANDNGCAEIDVLDYWTTIGFGPSKILGHAGVNFRSLRERRVALYLCGPLYAGVQLSTDQQSQTIWAPGPAAPGSWGGHCPPVCDDYTQIPASRVIMGTPIPAGIEEILVLLTWAEYKLCRGSYIPFAFDELHAVFDQAWLDRNQDNPAINTAALTAYFKTLQPES